MADKGKTMRQLAADLRDELHGIADKLDTHTENVSLVQKLGRIGGTIGVGKLVASIFLPPSHFFKAFLSPFLR